MKFASINVLVVTIIFGEVTGLMGNYDDNKTNGFILHNGTILSPWDTDTDRIIRNNFGQQFNEAPSINGTQKINAVINSPVEATFSARDDGSFSYDIINQPTSGSFTSISPTGDLSISWTPTNLQPERIRVTAVDNTGIRAEAIDVEIVLCSGCNDNGNCDYLHTRNQSSNCFKIATCTCDTGYSGDDCELDVDGCEDNPCALGRNCIDVTPVEEVLLNRTYNCSDCPAGYTIRPDEKCADINECLESTDNCPTNSNCSNIEGGYNCPCLSGFRKVGSICQDIDDCTERTSGCEQTCTNNAGGFTCSCVYGYELKSDGKTCNQNIDDCRSNPCQHQGVCNDGINKYHCTCKMGYTGPNCEINIECHTNPCLNGGICTDDQEMGYLCHCRLGFSGNNCQIGPKLIMAPTILLDKEKIVTEGSTAFSVLCYAEGMPLPNVTWEAIDGNLPRNALQIGHYLYFETITMADSGYYICTAKNEIGRDIKVIHIKVNSHVTRPHKAPSITAQSTMQVNYYSNATLVCFVNGYPKPSIVWTHYGVILPSTSETLIVQSVTNATVGVYTCIAMNDAGTSQANIVLKAIYDKPKITMYPQPYVGIGGVSHNFTCQAGGTPKPKIIWTLTDLSGQLSQLPPHSLNINGTVLHIYKLITSGHLSCTAKNEFGVDKAETLIIVKHDTSPFG